MEKIRFPITVMFIDGGSPQINHFDNLIDLGHYLEFMNSDQNVLSVSSEEVLVLDASGTKLWCKVENHVVQKIKVDASGMSENEMTLSRIAGVYQRRKS